MNFGILYSGLTKTGTALSRLAVTCVLSAARRLVLIFVNPLYLGSKSVYLGSVFFKKGCLKSYSRFGIKMIWHGLFSLILVCNNRGNLVFYTHLYSGLK